MIEIDLLREYGAVNRKVSKGAMLFQEGDVAVFYYQILSGSMKMNNYNDDGKEMIQGIFQEGKSFGEPAIFGNFPYPANGEAVKDSVLICLEKSRFVKLLKDHPSIAFDFLHILSKRLRYKAILSKEIKGYEAEHRILSLLEFLKKEAQEEEQVYEVKITRQTIADLTGLRVETVIRAIKVLKEKEKLQIKNRKLYL